VKEDEDRIVPAHPGQRLVLEGTALHGVSDASVVPGQIDEEGYPASFGLVEGLANVVLPLDPRTGDGNQEGEGERDEQGLFDHFSILPLRSSRILPQPKSGERAKTTRFARGPAPADPAHRTGTRFA
jgi:hypothetical protein